MKTLVLTLSLGIGVLMAGQLKAADLSDMKTQVMIVQTTKGLADSYSYIWPTTDNGAQDTPADISETGNIFDLYVLGYIWDEPSSKWIKKLYCVDTKVVTAFNPDATITVITGDNEWILGDPNGNFVKRTRADKAYTINVKATGLLTAADAPASAKSVRLDRTGVNYTPGNSTNPVNPAYSAVGPNSTPWTQETFSVTGDKPNWVVNDMLTPLGSSAVCGEERWQLTRLADVNPVIPESVLQNVTVQVWPVATAKLEGIKNGDIILDSFPSLSVELRDLYPDSYTYCRIYKGSDDKGTIIPGSESRFGAWYNKTNPGYTSPTLEPQNPAKLIMDLNVVAPTDGTYRISVYTETPFARLVPEPLASVSFEVNRRTAVRGTLSSGN